MPEHNTSAYKDGNKWVVYCVKCGIEEDALNAIECSERYVDKFAKKDIDKPSEPK